MPFLTKIVLGLQRTTGLPALGFGVAAAVGAAGFLVGTAEYTDEDDTPSRAIFDVRALGVLCGDFDGAPKWD